MQEKLQHRPYILSPCGSYPTLISAINSGADEVYFGLSSYNARQNAKNFTAEETQNAIRECKLRGVKTNITLNTLVSDREIKDVLKIAYDAYLMGADAFIVQDLGLASVLKKAIPEITLHASTQCAVHSVSGAKELYEMGFERVVLARELSKDEIEKIVALGKETEVFVHGALCVSHSGMCLMSSVIGKRSGNRGLCAQPCRLPYNFDGTKAHGNGKENYPLSLKDLTLAKHVPELSELGITSLKIEGRMKNEDYVSGVTGVWKKLVTENRNATDNEYKYLENLFSRSGFTDSYFTEKYKNDNRNMYGIRTDDDKTSSRNTGSVFDITPTKREVSFYTLLSPGKEPYVEITDGENKYSYTADFVLESALSNPLTESEVKNAFSKLGDTAFVCKNTDVKIDSDVFLPKSKLNELRRKAVEGFEKTILEKEKKCEFDENAFDIPVYKNKVTTGKVRLFPTSVKSLEEMVKKYASFETESVCIPLYEMTEESSALVEKIKKMNFSWGVKMPRVVFSSEEKTALELLQKAKDLGAVYAVCENIGEVPLIKKAGLSLYGGNAMNVYNSYTVNVLKELGFDCVEMSSELLTAQARDINKNGVRTSVVSSGRLELMVLESCVYKAHSSCKNTKSGNVCFELCDRMGKEFPVISERRLENAGLPCRNIVLNSVPVHLIDKPDELKKTGAEVYVIKE